MMHEISRELSGDQRPSLIDMMRNVSQRFDGAYSLVLLNAEGDMLVARDPLGIKPLCYAKEGPLFAAASESVALLNLGFQPESIRPLLPGERSRSSRAASTSNAIQRAANAELTATSNGSTSPTWPARWMAAACI
jgi:glutamine phosphoribosylpyrophosphate amidotransferase